MYSETLLNNYTCNVIEICPLLRGFLFLGRSFIGRFHQLAICPLIIINLFSFPGPSPPVQPINVAVTDITPISANITWTVPQVTYTPENYTVLYGEMRNNLTLRSEMRYTNTANLDFITARNIPYKVTLTGLSIGIQYCYMIEIVNTINTITTNQECFNTSETGKYIHVLFNLG